MVVRIVGAGGKHTALALGCGQGTVLGMAYDRGLQNRKKYALPVLAVTLVAALLAGAIDPANASRYTPIVAMLFFGVPFWFICKAYPKGVDIVPEPGDVGYEEWLETGK